MTNLRAIALANLRQFVAEHEPTVTEGFHTRIDPTGLCGDHGRVVTYRNRCPFCAGHVEPSPAHRFFFRRKEDAA